jgi:biopolymer transport protein ExbD
MRNLFKKKNSPNTIMAEINVTPLVDICLVLVIIFMVTTAMFLQPPFEVWVPKTMATDQGREGNLFVAIASDGNLAINEAKVTSRDFPEIIATRLLQSQTKRVIIRADARVLSQTVLQALDTIKQAGAQHISFGTEEKRD